MNRRGLFAGFLALPVSNGTVAGLHRFAHAQRINDQERPAGSGAPVPMISLIPSGAVTSQADEQVIENLDINAALGNALTVLHNGVTVRNCRIRHATGHGIHAEDAASLTLQDLDLDRVGTVPLGIRSSKYCNNINLDGCPDATVTRVKASRGSSNIYTENSERTRMSLLELHDARGPVPRGQNVQFNQSPSAVLQDFSAENGPTSWTEDNVSVYRSNRCVVRRGLVSYNNSPSGDGVMIEGSFDCLVEDVDAVQQGNGAFAAVPDGEVGSGGCMFLRCRTRDSYNTARDGRGPPTSNGLSFYTLISRDAQKHTIVDCHYDALANPGNLIWSLRAVNGGWTFTHKAFTPRPPVRLVFGW